MSLNLATFRQALERTRSVTEFGALVKVLGFEVEDYPVNYLEDRASELHKRVFPVADGLYRVGEYQTSSGTVSFWSANLLSWDEHSAKRERYRRRITKALVELEPAGDRKFLLALTAEGINDIELVLPRVRADKSFGTIRAVIDRQEPTNHHLQLLQDLVMAPEMSPVSTFRLWSDAFNVEKVAKRFYQEFRELHQRVLETLKRSNRNVAIIQNPENEGKVRRYVTRNLGRVLFLWFLQSKGWLDGDHKYFVNLYERRCRGRDDHNFFRDTLILLFFKALAQDKTQRCEAAKALGEVPFLNGGLFLQSRFEDELYGEDRKNIEIDLPNNLFDPRQHSSESPTVLGLLRSYRFTTRESTPDDQSLDPDPELLGKVFENLNEEGVRAKTGTFYTPREVVRFMCQEALDGYLAKKTGFTKEDFNWLRAEAIDPSLSDRRLTIAERKRIEDALDSVTVCDPAVGSGAFPVGMMQEILLLKQGLFQSTDVVVDIGGQQMAEWKEHIITNCLYGVDINPEAIEICHLRLWLSLVIDANEPVPLPNLDFRFVAGDSLVDRIGTEPLLDSLPRHTIQSELGLGNLGALPAIEEEIRILREEFTKTDTPSSARRLRERIKNKQIRALKIQIDVLRENHERALKNALENIKRLESLGANRRGLRTEEKKVSKLESNLKFLTELRASLDPWAPYKKPFLWPLEFPEIFEEGGFDVVVANPPYVRQESLSEKDQLTYQQAYSSIFKGTADLLVFFYGRAIQILRTGGNLSFITSNKFMRAGYGDGIREYLPSHLKIEHFIDFGDLPVFDAAAYPAILVGTKEASSDCGVCQIADLSHVIRRRIAEKSIPANVTSVREELENLRILLDDAGIKDFPQLLLRKRGWILEDSQLISLFDRLMQMGTPFGKFVKGNMYRGIVTGLNEAFVINQEKRNELSAMDPKSSELIKPWLRGRDIKRWKAEWPGLYVIFTRHGTQIERYSAIESYLEQWKDKLRPKKKSGDKGPGRKPGSYKWFEIQDSIEYYEEFEKPKLIWSTISSESRFLFDEEKYYTNQKCYIVTGIPSWVVPLLNSDVFFVLAAATSLTRLQNYFYEWERKYMCRLPIVTPPQEIQDRLSEIELELRNSHNSQLEKEANAIAKEVYGILKEESKLLTQWKERRRFSKGSMRS
ncbi:MAG: hypothetical protein AMJ92_00020 [candidate division Zixibacteria bacterium SM23_81]|nr:MAG: hypothetical protein AMJ92_00020 [candidate division Zixibacteria bacterium SM23_81]